MSHSKAVMLQRVVMAIYALVDFYFWTRQYFKCDNAFFNNILNIFKITPGFERLEVILLIHFGALFLYLMVKLFSKVCDLPKRVSILICGFNYLLFSSIFILACSGVMDVYVVMKTYVYVEMLICSITLCNYGLNALCERGK